MAFMQIWLSFVKMCQYAGLLSHAKDTLSPTILCLPKHSSSSHIKHRQFIPSEDMSTSSSAISNRIPLQHWNRNHLHVKICVAFTLQLMLPEMKEKRKRDEKETGIQKPEANHQNQNCSSIVESVALSASD